MTYSICISDWFVSDDNRLTQIRNLDHLTSLTLAFTEIFTIDMSNLPTSLHRLHLCLNRNDKVTSSKLVASNNFGDSLSLLPSSIHHLILESSGGGIKLRHLEKLPTSIHLLSLHSMKGIKKTRLGILRKRMTVCFVEIHK